MKKPLTFLLFFQFASVYIFGQNTKEQNFITTVRHIVIAFSNQDSATIENFIDKNIGVYQLDRIGIFDHFNHFKTLSFSDTTYPQILFRNAKGIQMPSLKYTVLPTWDCEKETWSKKGLFVDTTKTDHNLSKICEKRNKYQSDSISDKSIQYLYNLEIKSRRLVLFDKNQKELVFYLTYLNRKWILTIIDNISSDCSV